MGIVNYYMDMWSKWSHLIQTLTALTSHKVKFKWTDLEQKVFDEIKRAVYQDNLLEYTYFNRSFDIHSDASDQQLGSAISQKSKPIALYSRKTTGPQTRYTVTENEFLIIVETLKEFRTILLGQK